MSEANKDEAAKCLRIAQTALDAGDLEKARKFGEKAQQLYPSQQVERLLRSVASGQGSSSTARPNASSSASPGSTTNPGMRSRTTPSRTSASTPPQAATPRADAGTPQQRSLVASILSKSSSYYDVLSVPKTADDEEIKKAYRKLALKLHPDKCQATGAEDAFKLVSKAFTCLTDPDRRAYYDRTGHEDLASAQAARRASPGGMAGNGFYQQEMDPADLFNMMFPGMGHMFGRGPMGMNRPFPQQNPFHASRAQRAEARGDSGAQRASAGFSGGLLSNALSVFGRLSLPQKLFFVMIAFQMLPLVLSLLAWLWWAAVVGVPVYLICQEIVKFEQRAVYAPLRCLPGVSSVVNYARPRAQTVLDVTQPVATVVQATWTFLLEACRAVASV